MCHREGWELALACTGDEGTGDDNLDSVGVTVAVRVKSKEGVAMERGIDC